MIQFSWMAGATVLIYWCFQIEIFLLSPALLMRSGYCVELSTSSSSCSSMTLHWRRYGVSLAGWRMRVSLCRTPSTRSQSSSQRSSDQGREDRTSSWAMSPSSAQTVTPARGWKSTWSSGSLSTVTRVLHWQRQEEKSCNNDGTPEMICYFVPCLFHCHTSTLRARFTDISNVRS